MTEQKLLPIDHCRHLAFAAIGGFFGGYALLCRGGILGSSQTMNLLELVSDALFGRGSSVLLHLLCLVIYVVGVMFSVIVPHLVSTALNGPNEIRNKMVRHSPTLSEQRALIRLILQPLLLLRFVF